MFQLRIDVVILQATLTPITKPLIMPYGTGAKNMNRASNVAIAILMLVS
jgi:hypothetical protein